MRYDPFPICTMQVVGVLCVYVCARARVYVCVYCYGARRKLTIEMIHFYSCI